MKRCARLISVSVKVLPVIAIYIEYTLIFSIRENERGNLRF
jgi:hypothetical protein